MAFLARIRSDGKLIERHLVPGGEVVDLSFDAPDIDSGRLSLTSDSSKTLRYVSPVVSGKQLSSETETETLRFASPLFESRDSVEDVDNSSDDNVQPNRRSNISLSSWQEWQRDEVPPLKLGSKDSCMTFDRETDDYDADLHPSDAYNNWLTAKRKKDDARQRKCRELLEQSEREISQRKQLSEQRYREWCERKTRQTSKVESKPYPPTNTIPRKTVPGGITMRQSLRAWRIHKTKEAEKQQRLRQLQENEEKQERKRRSDSAFRNWLKTVAKRPKPVPLNEGLKSLRGTISDIFVNPKAWIK